LSAVSFYLTHKGGEIGLLDAQGNIQILYPGGKEWKQVSNHINFRNGITLKTGSEGKTVISTKKGADVRMDANTEVHFHDAWKIKLKTGQVLVSAKESEVPFEIDTPNGRIRTNKGTVNIQARDFETIVTAVKGEATLLLEGEEKKLLEGRQHKMTIGGEPVDIGAIINWSEGVSAKPDEKNGRK